VKKTISAKGVSILNSFRSIIFGVGLLLSFSCKTSLSVDAANSEDAGKGTPSKETADRWGVYPLSARVTGAGHFVDFRFRVEDPEKAKVVLDKRNKITMLDEGSGRLLYVPETKIGPLRGASMKPVQGKIYTVIFSNREGLVKKGSKVTVTIGDLQLRGITVE
jgi:hypothetical protein